MRIWIASIGLDENNWQSWIDGTSSWLSLCNVSRIAEYRDNVVGLAEFDFEFDRIAQGWSGKPVSLAAPLVFNGWLAINRNTLLCEDATGQTSSRSRIAETLWSSSCLSMATLLGRAVGEFAFAFWDQSAQQLIVTTDIYATCPICEPTVEG